VIDGWDSTDDRTSQVEDRPAQRTSGRLSDRRFRLLSTTPA